MSIDLERLRHPPDPVAAYLTGQLRPSQGPLLEAFAAESVASLEAFRPVLDVPYGPHPRAVFDLYKTQGQGRGTVAYLHAGYWQARDKAQFRFLASAFLAEGFDFALLNYPLCPDVTLHQLVDAVRDGLPRFLDALDRLGRRTDRLIVAGHSAGAHLGVELALTDWAAFGLPLSPIRGILPISGVYELMPLIDTPLNDKLRLTAEQAREASPLHRVKGALPPAHFLVGGLETAEFRAQSEAMHAAWMDAGGASRLQVVEDADHFSILKILQPGGAVMQAVAAMVSA